MFENETKATATDAVLQSFGAPLCHRAKPGDVVSFRRVELEDGGRADVLVRHEPRGGLADGTAVAYFRSDGSERVGMFHEGEPGGDMFGAAEFEATPGEEFGHVLMLPA